MNDALSTAATSAAHKDKSRAGVGTTAFGNAVVRAMEGHVHSRKPLVRDPVAEAMFNWKTKPKSVPWLFCVVYMLWCWMPFTWPVFFVMACCKNDMEATVDMVATRTKFIDDCINDAVKTRCVKQIVIIGSGLDARAVRLPVLHKSNAVVRMFELDFQAMLLAKCDIFNFLGFGGCFAFDQKDNDSLTRSHLVGTDLSLSPKNWQDCLKKSGFDKTKPTIRVLEGLTGYLEEEELKKLLVAINEFSVSGSEICATWNGSSQKTSGAPWAQKIHRTFCDNPGMYLSPLFWEKEKLIPIGQAICQAGIAHSHIPENDNTYWLSLYYKEKTAE